jgi:hypothetical protein
MYAVSFNHFWILNLALDYLTLSLLGHLKHDLQPLEGMGSTNFIILTCTLL